MKKNHKEALKIQICQHIGVLYPEYEVEFCGQQGHAIKVGRTFGFRIKHKMTGRYKGNIVWLEPTYCGKISQKWVKNVLSSSARSKR